MQGIVVILSQVLGGVQEIKDIIRVVIAKSLVVIDGAVEVEGEGAVGLIKFVAQGDVGAVNVKAVCAAIVVADAAIAGGIVLVYGGRDCVGVGDTGLEGDVGPEDKVCFGVQSLFDIQVCPLIF